MRKHKHSCGYDKHAEEYGDDEEEEEESEMEHWHTLKHKGKPLYKRVTF